MNISYNWLKTYVDFDLTAEELATALTSIGLEVGGVEEVETIKGGLKGLVVGEVVSCDDHPNSDHLHVCQVNLGEETPSQIVCGAPNVAKGQKVVVATIGTILYEGENSFVIKKSKLRGVESFGMICGENEIGVGTDTSGIIVLPQETPVGTLAATYYKVKQDYLLEVDITPNRADACSHYGVARDLYAYLKAQGKNATLRKDDVSTFQVDHENLKVSINIENKEACPRYCAITLTDCEVKESPQWLQERLNSIGVKPINNLVDITNYILFAYGQPLHCFDVSKINGKEVFVKTFKEANFVTLDGVERKLDEKDLVICDSVQPLCLAGILGGKDSGTYNTTKDILLESAYFNPTWVRKSARKHGINTDASFRFERGIDPNGQIYALKLAAILIKELAGGQISMELYDSNPVGVEDSEVKLTYSYINNLIGKTLPEETIKTILESLEIGIKLESDEDLLLSVPAYRVDVKRPCDIVEDILRIYGYNKVELPTIMQVTPSIKGKVDESFQAQNLVSEQLVGMGFNEILNNSLTKVDYYQKIEGFAYEHCVKLMNPLSNDLGVMRQTLLFGGLETLAYNINRQNKNLKCFEFGNCYNYQATQKDESKNNLLQAYQEALHLGVWVTGKKVDRSWIHSDEESSVYELKAYLFSIIERLGLNRKQIREEEGNNPIYSASLVYKDTNDVLLFEFGIVSSKVLKYFDIPSPVYYADINWTEVMKKVSKKSFKYETLSKFPSVSRDLALLVDKEVTFAQIEKVLFATEKKVLKRVELFDVYEGKNIELGKKSYAINFVLQDTEKTLTDKQIDKIMQSFIANLEKQLHAKLR